VTGLRLLAAAGGALALAALGAGLLPGRRAPEPVRPPPAAARAAAIPAAVADAGASAPDLRAVPAGILARAADARALDRDPERAPLCRPAPAPRREASCAPPRDSVEIQWDVGKDP
jgi:hypothetical protein